MKIKDFTSNAFSIFLRVLIGALVLLLIAGFIGGLAWLVSAIGMNVIAFIFFTSVIAWGCHGLGDMLLPGKKDKKK